MSDKEYQEETTAQKSAPARTADEARSSQDRPPSEIAGLYFGPPIHYYPSTGLVAEPFDDQAGFQSCGAILTPRAFNPSFCPDRGAASIAGMDLSVAGASRTIFTFAQLFSPEFLSRPESAVKLHSVRHVWLHLQQILFVLGIVPGFLDLRAGKLLNRLFRSPECKDYRS